jgi:hypothetical protein
LAVEAVVSGEEGFVAGVVGEHGGILCGFSGRGWLETDMVVGLFLGGDEDG